MKAKGRKAAPIPINNFGDDVSPGISIEKISFGGFPTPDHWEQPERHDRHSFFLLEKGTVTIEIDFKRHTIASPALIYMHPDQVHRIIAFDKITVYAWAIDNEHLNAAYSTLLEEGMPIAPIPLQQPAFELIASAASLCIQLSARKNDPLHPALLKDSGNLLVGLLLSLAQEEARAPGNTTRSKLITNAFRKELSSQFTKLRRPADYAAHLHVSVSYLNECVKEVTGHSVSYHIQQRIVLEAKRLLFHSNQSVKEIAAALGFDDYAYFSRLFTRVAGASPLTLRNKNHD